MKDAVATMGDFLPDDAGGRDAVHVAVVSAIAGERLFPAQDIGFAVPPVVGVEGEATTSAKHIGIVDPFLKSMVMPGQRFWIYLYPRSITGLNHQWTHPAFPDAKPGESYARPSEKIASERWIKEWAEPYGVTLPDMMLAAQAHLDRGEYFSRGGTFEGERVPDEFWTHYERVTGKTVPENDRQSFFTCSC